MAPLATEAVRRIAYEAVVDAAADGQAHLELRFGPTTHVTDEHVSIEHGRVVTIDTDDRGPVIVTYADGERLGPLPVTMEVVPAALHVLG